MFYYIVNNLIFSFYYHFFAFDVLEDGNKISKLTVKEIILKGTILASIVTIPSLLSFLLSWSFLNDVIQAAILGAVVHFIAMGFSFKISKKLLVKHD